MADKKFDIETIRHSLSHVMASAVADIFSEAKLGIGPAIADGFYYDFDLPRTLVPKDLEEISKKMKEIINSNLSFDMSELSKDEAKEKLSNQTYKKELIDDLGEDKVSVYKLGDFVDLCRGPHVDSVNDLKNVAFRLDKIAGAYWKGSEKNKMLQRIYALAFETEEELKKFLNTRVEAEKRDHKKLGVELDLFCFSDLVGAGLPLFTPKGTLMKDILQKKVEDICKKYGFQKVMTPHLAKIDLYKTSGHADKFKEELFHVSSDKGHNFVIRPVLCPHQTQIYASKIRSYRDLPIRYMESEKQYRAEKSGEIGGLSRVYAITVEDGHSFCTIDQVKDEVKGMINIIKDFYSELGLWGNHKTFLSLRDKNTPEKYIGDDKDWDECEKMLQDVANEMGLNAERQEGEAALYGPKIDFMFKDALGRDVQIPTVQLDFATPKRFNLSYIDNDGKEQPPVMVHRAILGSYERFLALVIEHFAGAFPVWLAPVQAIILPISDKHLDYANKVAEELREKDIRVEVDNRVESIGRKIRDAEMQKIPYMLIVGDKEISANKVAVRRYGEGDKGQIEIIEVISEIKK